MSNKKTEKKKERIIKVTLEREAEVRAFLERIDK